MTFLLVIAFFVLFLGIAALATSELGALGAILSSLLMGNQLSSKRKLLLEIETKAIAYGFEGLQVDGNDVFSVYKSVKDAVKKAKQGKGPTFFEFIT